MALLVVEHVRVLVPEDIKEEVWGAMKGWELLASVKNRFWLLFLWLWWRCGNWWCPGGLGALGGRHVCWQVEEGFWFKNGTREMVQKVGSLGVPGCQLQLAVVSFPSSAVSWLQMYNMLFIDRKVVPNYSGYRLQIFHNTNQISMNPSRLLQSFAAIQCSVQCKISSIYSE